MNKLKDYNSPEGEILKEIFSEKYISLLVESYIYEDVDEHVADKSVRRRYRKKYGEIDGILEVYVKGHRKDIIVSRDNYKKGKRDGLCIVYNMDESISSKCYYKDGFLEGKRIYINENKDGEIIEEITTYAKGILKGLKEQYLLKDGKRQLILKTYCWDNKENGIKKTWDSKGRIKSRTMIIDDEMNGPHKEWFRNGNIKEISYHKDELLHGLYKVWHKNGKLEIQTNFNEGKKDGKWLEWYKNGKQKIEYNYIDGLRNGIFIQWWDNGNIKEQSEYKNGELDGITTWWYSNGIKEYKINFVNNKRNGLTTEWYSSGVKKKEGNYIDDEEVGDIKNWDEEGNLID